MIFKWLGVVHVIAVETKGIEEMGEWDLREEGRVGDTWS